MRIVGRERSIGIAMGITGVVIWIVIGASAVLVLGLLAAVLSTPPPVSEHPLPEWNRA